MRELPFSKLQACGNDFVVIDARSAPTELSATQRAKLCDRHLGVGCDQLLVMLPSDSDDIDAHYSIFNADGAPALQCGNGLRALGHYLLNSGSCNAPRSAVLRLRGPSGIARVEASGVGEYRAFLDLPSTCVELGKPWPLPCKALGQVQIGNRHTVIFTGSQSVSLNGLREQLASQFEAESLGNIELVRQIAGHQISIEIDENGVGPTLACGSGACAAAYFLTSLGLLKASEPITVQMPGGALIVEILKDKQQISLTGAAAEVFTGVYFLEDH